MSSILPFKPSSRDLLVEMAAVLKPEYQQINSSWRTQMFSEFSFDGQMMTALERLTFGTGFALFSHSDLSSFFENVQYFGRRLAKLQVDTRAVARSLELYQQVAEPYLWKTLRARAAEAAAALEAFNSGTFVTVAGAYYDAHSSDSAALMSISDAELSAPNLAVLLERVLETTTKTFGATVGILLLQDADAGGLRISSSVGFQPGELNFELLIPPGRGFSGEIAQTGEPSILPDVAGTQGLLNPQIVQRAKALWGMPLKNGEQVIGVLLIGFEKPYNWLPTERELMRAIADRSAMAIERARMTDALREREARIAELSGHLLMAQERERKRISRELHDETGQALMVVRLYLGMLENSVHAHGARGKIRETLDVVDRTIEGLRRIIGKLSPLVLQELGLVAAIRKEAKDLAKNAGVRARVNVAPNFGRLAPELETAVYRVVQEALHNVAKHAHATTVNVHISTENARLALLIEDDGMGIIRKNTFSERPTFGLAGMRERISTLGGSIRIASNRGQGTRIEISLPTSIESMPAEAGFMARSAVANGPVLVKQ